MGTKAVAVAAGGVATILGLAFLPLLATTTVNASGTCGTGPVTGGPVAVIESTIRQVESGDNYSAQAPGSSASGAYQFLDSSWAGYSGYPRAYLAPPEVQDAKAAALIGTVLAGNNNDVSAVPVAWYIGHVPPAGSPEWDTVPSPGAGNRLTPRQYQQRWMGVYEAKLTGQPDATSGTATPDPCPTGASAPTLPGGWALPGPRALLDRTADQINAPHHDHPAWDWPIPIGTPVYAIRAGTVIGVSANPNNCAGQTTCDACGLGLTIADAQGVQWTYCHGSQRLVNQGETVTAGQQILASGNSGNSTGPHLHIGIAVDGVARCPQQLIASLYRNGTGLDPASLPTTGCTY
jgi:hypothetical protein